MFDVSKWVNLDGDVWMNLGLVQRVLFHRHLGAVRRAECFMATGNRYLLETAEAARLEQVLRTASAPIVRGERPLGRPEVCEGPLPEEEARDLQGPRYAEEERRDGPLSLYGH